jgi:hypothetical protein
MRRDSGIPFLIVCVLIGLSAGAAVLGFRQAPSGNDVTVHNAAGELLAASSFTALYTTERGQVVLKYKPPDTATEVLVRGSAGKHRGSVQLTGSKAKATISPLLNLSKVTGFKSARSSTYTGSISITTLIPAAEQGLVHGTEHYAVTVAGGFVVTLGVRYTATTPIGRESGGGIYQFILVNGAKAPKAPKS